MVPLTFLKNNLSFNHSEKNFSLGFQYGHFETDGFRQNNNFERDGFLLHSSFNLSSKNTLSFLINYVDYTAQIPSAISQSAFDEDPTQAAPNWLAAQGFEDNRYTLLGASYSHDLTPRLTSITSIYYTYLDQFEARPFNIVDEFTNGFGLRSRILGTFNIAGREASYSTGIEIYNDEFNNGTFRNDLDQSNGNGSVQGAKIGNNKEFRRQSNIFGTLGLPLSQAFEAQLGLNLNQTIYDFRDQFNTGTENTSADRDFDAILLPNLTLRYGFSEDQSLYANVSRGFSNPGFEETLTPDGALNPDIDQETGINYELGTQLALDKKRLNLSLAIYRLDVQNLLVGERVAEDQFVGRNAGSTRHQGLEVDVNYQLKLGNNLNLNPFLSYTFNDHSFVEFINRENDFSGNLLTGVPRHRVTSGVQLRHNSGFYWNTTHLYVGAIPINDANTLSSETYNLFHSRLGYQKELSKHFSFRLDFGINNIFNIRYAQSVAINPRSFGGAPPRLINPGDGRNVYGGVQLRYTL